VEAGLKAQPGPTGRRAIGCLHALKDLRGAHPPDQPWAHAMASLSRGSERRPRCFHCR
jgi:hypothetical protein